MWNPLKLWDNVGGFFEKQSEKIWSAFDKIIWSINGEIL
ncbi:unnamed protein product, partial [marine sediment metagenome]